MGEIFQLSGLATRHENWIIMWTLIDWPVFADPVAVEYFWWISNWLLQFTGREFNVLEWTRNCVEVEEIMLLIREYLISFHYLCTVELIAGKWLKGTMHSKEFNSRALSAFRCRQAMTICCCLELGTWDDTKRVALVFMNSFLWNYMKIMFCGDFGSDTFHRLLFVLLFMVTKYFVSLRWKMVARQ